MGNSLFLMILLQILLIALNAIFACAEIAVISMNDNKLERMAADGDKRARRLAQLTAQPARFLSTIQIAITCPASSALLLLPRTSPVSW